MPVAECVERVSHREFVEWCEWFGDEWDRPDRTDHYLMRIAHEVQVLTHVVVKIMGGKGKIPSFDDVKIKFTKAKPDGPPSTPNTPPENKQTPAERAAYSKAVWMSNTRGAGGLQYIPPPETPPEFNAPAASQIGRR